MPLVKSLSVGNGDTFYIRHNSDNFTIIDCCLNDDQKEAIVEELKEASAEKGITRFISTHPDQDHILGLEYLDEKLGIVNFYCVANSATKDSPTTSFEHYCKLRDSSSAYHVYKGCKRKWMNQSSDERGAAGISILWPNVSNEAYKAALKDAADGLAFNNMSLVARYSIEDGATFMWIGDLHTKFMQEIFDDIELTKTTVVFAPHHGRDSGKIPNSWLERLDPQIIVIGEAPSRHLNYYTGYKIVTQNDAGDITMDCIGDKVHFYVSNKNYSREDVLDDEGMTTYPNYVGSITVETEYTLDG
ncbi:MBL fold metallo-hydrolase [Mesorhizobium japonicum]|uniref:MBL fold metallo-hydrolase n=1 Tax=Mesorhizobium japonicum TaxID=2066070 RepID=UPI0005CA61D4|nr:MBL fold metallo-hydrolase [Mesorhizobium japonicum]